MVDLSYLQISGIVTAAVMAGGTLGGYVTYVWVRRDQPSKKDADINVLKPRPPPLGAPGDNGRLG